MRLAVLAASLLLAIALAGCTIELPKAVCGNNECQIGEDANSCPQDCSPCTDSDGGRNVYLNGTVSGGSYGVIGYNHDPFTDYCILNLPNELTEYFCIGGGNIVQFNNMHCLNGCKDGACMPSEVCPAPELTCKGNIADGVCFWDTPYDRILETSEIRAELIIEDRITEINNPIKLAVKITNKKNAPIRLVEGDCENKPIDSICIGLPKLSLFPCGFPKPHVGCIESQYLPDTIAPGQTVEAFVVVKFLEPTVDTPWAFFQLPYTIPAGSNELMKGYYRRHTNLKPLKSSIIAYDPNSGNNTYCDINIIPEKIADNGRCCEGIFYPTADYCDKAELAEFGSENLFFNGLAVMKKTGEEYKKGIGVKNIGVFYTYEQSDLLPGEDGAPPYVNSLGELQNFQKNIFKQVNKWLDKESVNYLGHDAIDYNYTDYYIDINASEYPSGPRFKNASPVMEQLILELEQKTGVDMNEFDYVVLYLPVGLQTWLYGGATGVNAFVTPLSPVYNDLYGFFLKNKGLADPKQNIRVLIHESLHPLGATDIYGGIEGTAIKDFSLNFFNCIMGSGGFNEKIDHFSVCNYTAAQIGWMDLDCDGIPEALEP